MARFVTHEQLQDQKTWDTLGAELQAFGGLLGCQMCGITQPLDDISNKLREGWPKHCGYTMRWSTQRQIDNDEMND